MTYTFATTALAHGFVRREVDTEFVSGIACASLLGGFLFGTAAGPLIVLFPAIVSWHWMSIMFESVWDDVHTYLGPRCIWLKLGPYSPNRAMLLQNLTQFLMLLLGRATRRLVQDRSILRSYELVKFDGEMEQL